VRVALDAGGEADLHPLQLRLDDRPRLVPVSPAEERLIARVHNAAQVALSWADLLPAEAPAESDLREIARILTEAVRERREDSSGWPPR